MTRRPLLVVDDEPTNLDILRQSLKQEHALVFATSGQGALAAAKRHNPSLVLLDIQMPDLDGYEVCRRLKADPATEAVPVIFVTTLIRPEEEEAGFAAGAVDYILKPVSPPTVRARVRTHLSLVRATELERSHRAAISMLGEAGHYNDSDTGVHIWRMAAYARALAEEAGLDPDQVAMIELAAPMHDTGKIGIPDDILRKPGPLTEAEWVIMRSHTEIGHSILSMGEAPLFNMAAEIALNHHEKWDGSGYPRGLKGEDIPRSARIVAIADVFDALCTKRPYKEPWPMEQVLATLKEGDGSHFDPSLFRIFLGILPRILEIKAEWDAKERDLAAKGTALPD